MRSEAQIWPVTVIDRRGGLGRPANPGVVEAIDADGFFALLAERLAGLP